jgi:hypothetical protein
MAVIFKWDGIEVDLDDVSMETYAEIEKVTSIPWYRLTQSPMAHAAAGPMLARKCAETAGVELPDPITPKILVSLFEVSAEPNSPTEFSDGIPDPKAQDSEPETT